jgi:hypothetical protein
MPLDHPTVRRVADALRAAGATGAPIALTDPAPTAAAAAAQLGCDVGAIANSLVFDADGQRYAVAVLTVSGAATATFVGIAPNAGLATPMATSPRMTATLTGQSDLPASISSGSLTTTSQVHYGEVYP